MHTVVLVLVQVLIIIGLSRLMGLGCRVLKQPLVIGEIIAGIMLGPSLLGLLAPNVDASGQPLSVKIQGIVQGETLTGQISLSSMPIVAEFTAGRENPVEKAGYEH